MNDDTLTIDPEKEERKAYDEAMGAIRRLMRIRPEVERGTPADVLLLGLAAAIEDYEEMRWPIGRPSRPVEGA